MSIFALVIMNFNILRRYFFSTKIWTIKHIVFAFELVIYQFLIVKRFITFAFDLLQAHKIMSELIHHMKTFVLLADWTTFTITPFMDALRAKWHTTIVTLNGFKC